MTTVEALVARFPGPRVGILGSTRCWHCDTEATCLDLGRRLAATEWAVFTGGMPGVGQAVAQGYQRQRRADGRPPRLVHVLPWGEFKRPEGETVFMGTDMAERRRLLAALAPVYVVLEGGPGTAEEVAHARARGARLLPVPRSGGAAADVRVDVTLPAVLSAREASAADVAEAMFHLLASHTLTPGAAE